jgi:hypothetical protein
VARPPSPRLHYDLELTRLTGMIRAVEKDEHRGVEWKESTLDLLRRAREQLAQASPADKSNKR